MCQALVGWDVNVDAADKNKVTALMLAAIKNHLAVVEALISSGEVLPFKAYYSLRKPR